jgi:phage shock protein E
MSMFENETYSQELKIRLILFLIIATVAAIPLVVYQLTLGRTPTILPRQARELIKNNQDSLTILIDVRTPEEYQARHIDGSRNWPLSAIQSLTSKEIIPSAFKGKTLLMICNAGIRSRTAVNHIIHLKGGQALSVRGGIQEWVAGIEGSGGKGCIYDFLKTASGKSGEIPFRQSPMIEQIIAVVSGFGIKPLYSLLSLFLVIVLWRSSSLDLAALRWGMVFFFVGENFCALNYGLYNDTSYLFEYLHGIGMLLCFSFTTFAIMEGVDRRILILSDPNRKCSALGLCGGCIKYDEVPCGLRRAFFVIIPAFLILAAMPLFAPYQLSSYNTDIFGTGYNYSHFLVHQIFEARCCPIAAMVLLGITLLVLVFQKVPSLLTVKIIFASAMGFMGFGLFRTILLGLYNQNMLWFIIWEEVTEFLFILGVCIILWIFRKGLFHTGRPNGQPHPSESD